MSTTGPVTRAMRPTPPAVAALSAVVFLVVGSHGFSLSVAYFADDEGVGAADDLGDLLGDLGLARVVGAGGCSRVMSLSALSLADFIAFCVAACFDAADCSRALKMRLSM